ncbi:MAG: 6-phosphogluconolactonase [Actinomycetota bacterium]
MSFRVEAFGSAEWPGRAAAVIGPVLPAGGAVVLTGGDAAASLYPELAVYEHDWSHTDVLFSDERVVPPDDPASNYRMARELLLSVRPPRHVHRVRGEDRPHDAADEYSRAIEHIMERGPDVMLLGLGPDAHIASLFPLSPVFDDGGDWSQAVTRPDGLHGVTLTPRALLRAAKVVLIVAGAAKADAVRRAVRGTEGPRTCPVRILADHPDATLLVDEAAAAEL